MKELFSDDYEQYFIRIDLTREYREKVKIDNVIKKKRFAWKLKETEIENVKTEKGNFISFSVITNFHEIYKFL